MGLEYYVHLLYIRILTGSFSAHKHCSEANHPKRVYKQKIFMVVVSFYIPIINLLIDCDFSQSGCSFRTFLNGDTHIF